MSYYDVDAILTDSQKVPSTFEMDVHGLGYLEGNAGTDMKKGTRVALPLWLAEMLAISPLPGTAEAVVTLELPDAFSARILNALRADPRTVDLRALAPHFYHFAARYLELFDDAEMVDVLSEAFKRRAADIADHARNPQGVREGTEFLRGLDETERQIFRAAHDSAAAVKAWTSDLKKR